MNRTMIGLLLIAPMMGCDVAATVTPPVNAEVTYDDVWAHAGTADRGPATLDPALAQAGEGHVARRVTVDQLRRSIPALFDGITWTVPFGRDSAAGFDVLSRTLGEPDYIQSTAENRQASPLFAKFMDDMASDVCRKAVERDMTRPAGDRVVVLDESDPDATLRFLRLKLHGIYVPEGSMEGLGELRSLYDGLAADAPVVQAWLGVCIAMLTAPEMMAY